jgi:hypothetical protein
MARMLQSDAYEKIWLTSLQIDLAAQTLHKPALRLTKSDSPRKASHSTFIACSDPHYNTTFFRYIALDPMLSESHYNIQCARMFKTLRWTLYALSPSLLSLHRKLTLQAQFQYLPLQYLFSGDDKYQRR